MGFDISFEAQQKQNQIGSISLLNRPGGGIPEDDCVYVIGHKGE